MFSEVLKQLRKDRKVTQTELGNFCGYSHVAVVKWENGQREPSIETLIKIADFFNVTLDYLLGRIEPLPLTPLQKELSKKIRSLSDEQAQIILGVINQLK